MCIRDSPEGERVVNEKASNHDILEVELQQTDSMLYLLMDQENYDVWSSKLPNTGFNQKAVEGYLEANGTSTPVFAHADSIAELAGIVGMDPAVLQATVDDYNAGVEAGTDEFGRSGDYLKTKIGEGPYYLVEQKPRYATTMGGLVAVSYTHLDVYKRQTSSCGAPKTRAATSSSWGAAGKAA